MGAQIALSPDNSSFGGGQGTARQERYRLESVPFDVPQGPGDTFVGGERVQQRVDLSQLCPHFGSSAVTCYGVNLDGVTPLDANHRQEASPSQSGAHESDDDGP